MHQQPRFLRDIFGNHAFVPFTSSRIQDYFSKNMTTKTERNEAIRLAVFKGECLKVVAHRYNISIQRVSQIVKANPINPPADATTDRLLIEVKYLLNVIAEKAFRASAR